MAVEPASTSHAPTFKAYRIVSPRWAGSALSGEGARLYGGRWNSAGRPVVYLAGSRALAALEMLVHLTTSESRKKPYLLIQVEIPSNHILKMPRNSLPSGWRATPPDTTSQQIGNNWLEASTSLAMFVPSTIIPEETNLLLNPAHPDFRVVGTGSPNPFQFDPRLGPD